MEKLIKSAKDGSYEAMTVLALDACESQRAHQAFCRVMEENLTSNTASIQDMKRGRLPVVPSLNPKDVLNLSCNSMLALIRHLRSQFQLQHVCPEDCLSILAPFMPAISFWLCLFCEYIILPSRTAEFTFIDFHRVVVLIMSWTSFHGSKITVEPKLFTGHLPFLWFHPPTGCTKYDLDDARALFTAVDHWLLTSDEPLRELFVRRLEENSTLTANCIVQFIVDVFSSISEEFSTGLQYQSFSVVASSTLQLASRSLSIYTALLKNNILRWMCLVLRLVTRRVRFTDVTLSSATCCVNICLVYIYQIMRDGHSYIHQLLGYDILLYMMKALRNLHAHPELIDQWTKSFKTILENQTVTIIRIVILHLVYASILKRSRKAILKIQRHVEFLNDPALKQVREAWTEFVNIASYRSDILRSIPDLSCGNEQCPGTSIGNFMVCSGCQFTRYCSRVCQKDDWSSGDHHSLCIKIKQFRTDGGPLPICLSDKRALEGFNRQYVERYRAGPSEWNMPLYGYIAWKGKPDPMWPMIWILDYRVVNVEPEVNIVSSEQCAGYLDPEYLAKAREGAGTLVYSFIPNGQCTVKKAELVPS